MEERIRRFLIVAALCACAAAVTAGAAQAAAWQLQAHLPGEGVRPNLPLLGIDCPSKSSCVAVGEDDAVVSSDDPTGGPSKWDMVQPNGEAESDCHSSWVPPCPPTTSRRVRGVSCPAAQLCVAVTAEGYVYSSTNPDGPGGAWGVADVDGTGRDTHLMDVSCPSPSLCVAVSGERYTAGKVLFSTNPTGPASAWHEVQLDETLQFTGISCGAPSFCVAVAEHGRIVVSTNPTGPAGAWKEVGTPGGPGDLDGVDCVETALCVAGNAGGNLLFSTDPGTASWGEVASDASVQITAVSCLPSRQCAAVDNNGDVLTTSDPTAGRGSWTRANLIPYADPPSKTEQPLNALFGVSCVSSSFCALSGADGRIYTSEDPFSTASGPTGGGKKQGKSRHGPRRPHVRISGFSGNFYLRDRHGKDRIGVRFHANGAVRRFLCSRDGGGFRACRSPYRYRSRLGRHVFRVRAVGLTGLRGPVASKRFRVAVRPTFRRGP